VSHCTRAHFARLALIGALAAALGLTGCGRKGPLDPPPSASAVPSAQAAPAGSSPNPLARSAPRSREAFGPDGQPIASPGPKKSLPLDWLLD